jgi:hypothetical protein
MKSTVFRWCKTRVFSWLITQKNCWSRYSHAQSYTHYIQVLSRKPKPTKGSHRTCWITSCSGQYCTIQWNGLQGYKTD